jgi:uncharacterized membrane protein YhaH (DUF805 family)
MNHIRTCFENYINCKGRATRAEFFSFISFTGVSLLVAGTTDDSAVLTMASWLFVACLLPATAVLVRRLHDADYSGGWIFFLLIPFIGFLVLTVMLIQETSPSTNRFGPRP